MKTFTTCAAILTTSIASAQTPQWNVELTPTLSPLPIGLCGAIHLKLTDPATKDVPRTPQGYRITMADFDLSVNGGTAAAANQIDAAHFEACGCQGATVGTTVLVTARYPAQYLAPAARVPGVAIEKTASFTIGPAKGGMNSAGCATLASSAAPAPTSTTTTAAPTPAGRIPVGTTGATTATTRTPGGIVPAAPVAPAPAAAPVPVNPGNLIAQEGTSRKVTLIWDQVPEASFYAVFGPGLTPGGQRVENQPVNFFGQVTNKVSVTAENVPYGANEWRVASYYSPGNISTPASQFSKVSLDLVAPAGVTPAATTPSPAAPLSGKYLVTLTGIRCYQASMDDMLSRDGVGDEVYAATYIRHYDRRSGNLVDATIRQSASHGDVTNFGNQRLQGGTRSQTGGIHDGDMLPGPALLATRSVPAQDVTFPLRLWEGTLTDDVDALVMSPSLWEQDVGDSFYNQWLQFEKTINNSLFAKQGVQDQITQKQFGTVVFGMSGVDTNTSGQSIGRMVLDAGMMLGGAGVPILGLLTTSADRPIGIVQNGRDVTALPNHTVILTREIIEAALAKPAIGPIPSPVANAPQLGILAGGVPAIARVGVIAPKPGVIVVHLQEKDVTGTMAFPERPAIYQMYIQVERVP